MLMCPIGVILSPIHVKLKLFPLSIVVDSKIHWVWIIRLIDEVILLSAIFSILLASCWGLY
jgi:hypothetical protein